MSETSPQLGSGIRWRSLDVLRGVAVLLVLFRHLALKTPTTRSTGLYQFVYTLQRGGWVGVDLFFVLSGFLVSGILFRQYQRDGHIHPIRFLIRRGFKIYPAFWALIFVTVVWQWYAIHQLLIKNAVVELLFVQNYLQGLYAHTWSLAVEEHCYIVLCLLFSILAFVGSGKPNPFRMWPAFVILASIAALALRIETIPPLTEKNFVLATGATHLRYDGFLIGTLVAYAFYFSEGRFLSLCQRFQAAWILLGIACIVPVFFLEILEYRLVSTWLFTTNAIGGALLLMGALGTRGKSTPATELLATIGENSYSIYLWHPLVCLQWLPFGYKYLGIKRDVFNWPIGFIVTSILVGILMSHLIERPALKLRDRWFPG